MNARLRAPLIRAAQTNTWQSLTFDLAITDRGAREPRLLKVSRLGLKSAREVLDIAVGIDKEIRARRMLLPSQIPLEVPPSTIEETTPFFDALRWQPISQRLRNIQAAAESTTRIAEPSLTSDLLQARSRMSEGGAEHGYPSCKDYPEYEKLHVIGYHFKENGRFDWMRRALAMLSSEIGEEDGASWAPFIEFVRHDTGGWYRVS